MLETENLTPSYVQAYYLSKFVNEKAGPANLKSNLNVLKRQLKFDSLPTTDSREFSYLSDLGLAREDMPLLIAKIETDKLARILAELSELRFNASLENSVFEDQLKSMLEKNIYFSHISVTNITAQQRLMITDALKTFLQDFLKKTSLAKAGTVEKAIDFALKNFECLSTDLAEQLTLLDLAMQNAKGDNVFKVAMQWFNKNKDLILTDSALMSSSFLIKLIRYQTVIEHAKISPIDPFNLQAALIDIFGNQVVAQDYMFEDLVKSALDSLKEKAIGIAILGETDRIAPFNALKEELQNLTHYFALSDNLVFLTKAKAEIKVIVEICSNLYSKDTMPDTVNELIALSKTINGSHYDVQEKIATFLSNKLKDIESPNPNHLNTDALKLLLNHSLYGEKAQTEINNQLKDLFINLYAQAATQGGIGTAAAQITHLLDLCKEIGGETNIIAGEFSKGLECFHKRIRYLALKSDLLTPAAASQFDESGFKALEKHFPELASIVDLNHNS